MSNSWISRRVSEEEKQITQVPSSDDPRSVVDQVDHISFGVQGHGGNDRNVRAHERFRTHHILDRWIYQDCKREDFRHQVQAGKQERGCPGLQAGQPVEDQLRLQ